MFVRACGREILVEGGLEVCAVERRLVLILWPKGGTPRAYQGFCPHAREALVDGRFDGTNLVCRYHDWMFDGRNGKCIDGKRCKLAEYPMKVEDDQVLVDVDGVAENYA